MLSDDDDDDDDDDDGDDSPGCIECLLLGRLPKVDLIILEGRKMSVRPSVHKKFLRFQ